MESLESRLMEKERARRLKEESKKRGMTLTEFLMDCIVAGWGVITGQEKASNKH